MFQHRVQFEANISCTRPPLKRESTKIQIIKCLHLKRELKELMPILPILLIGSKKVKTKNRNGWQSRYIDITTSEKSICKRFSSRLRLTLKFQVKSICMAPLSYWVKGGL